MTDEYLKGYEAGQLKILKEVIEIYLNNKYPEYLEEDLYQYLHNNAKEKEIEL